MRAVLLRIHGLQELLDLIPALQLRAIVERDGDQLRWPLDRRQRQVGGQRRYEPQGAEMRAERAGKFAKGAPSLRGRWPTGASEAAAAHSRWHMLLHRPFARRV